MGLFGFLILFSAVKATSNQINKLKPSHIYNLLKESHNNIPQTKSTYVAIIPRQCKKKLIYTNEEYDLLKKNRCRCIGQDCAESKNQRNV